MRLVRLVVQYFMSIERATVDFGQHLNVLHGPNDAGKTSLAWAIRAVLLLQHNQAQHTRFVSWYGGGDPHVELTFVDDDGRYWRVTKTFAKTGGHSGLDASKDGRTFVSEAKGREVDQRLRDLLGWGLPAAGGKGPRGMSDSFITQVLLADQEQDSVRKVLFESSLEADDDPSGRARLTRALGALAQDPLFKKVLDRAVPYVDRAFSATGKRRTAASSPFVETDRRIKDLLRQQAEFEDKVKETSLAEARIVELHGQRDEAIAAAQMADESVTDGQRQLETRRQREALMAEVRETEAKLNDAEGQARMLAAATADVERLASEVQTADATRVRLEGEATAAGQRRDDARRRLDAAVEDEAAVAREAALQTDVEAAAEAKRAASRTAEQAVDSLRVARDVVAKVGAARKAVAKTRGDARAKADAQAQAEATLTIARREHAAAEERLRELRSSDRAMARELARKELEHRATVLAHERTQLDATMKRVDEARSLAGVVALARDAEARTATELTAARRAADAQSEKARELEERQGSLRRFERFARLQDTRAQLAEAERAVATARKHRERAEALRVEAAEAARAVTAGLPDAAALNRLRRLNEDLRIAEAALGGGLSVAVRPRRPLAVTIARDGGTPAEQTTEAPLTLTAARTLSLRIPEVLDIEVTAGQERARRDAERAREAWRRDGEPVLTAHGAATVEELEALRSRSDLAGQRAATLRRDADDAEREAARAPAVDVDALRSAVDEATAELGHLDRRTETALTRELTAFGGRWQAELRRRQADAASALEEARTLAERARGRAIELEAELKGRKAETSRLEEDVARSQDALAGPWAEIAQGTKAELERIEDEQARLAAQIRRGAEQSSTDEAKAVDEVDGARRRVTSLETELAATSKAALGARDAMVQAEAELQSCSASAAALDADRMWATALTSGEGELALDWWSARVTTSEQANKVASERHLGAVKVLADARAAREGVLRRMREQVQALEANVAPARAAEAAAAAEQRRLVDLHARAQTLREELRVVAAGVNVDELRRSVTDVRARLSAFPQATSDVTDAELNRREAELKRWRARRAELDEELAKAQGALEQVGGATVREKLAELEDALVHEREREREIDVEYEAWRLLVDTLRESGTRESAHLGRALAAPVSERFRQLTGGRYGALELGTHLAAEGLHVAGELREIGALSAGTQDQLATLLRVCIAEQLRSSIILDDHLSQSDPGRVAWFSQMLRDAARQVQIVFITCRPQDLLSSEELSSAVVDGPTRVVNLADTIRRFPEASRPSLTPVGTLPPSVGSRSDPAPGPAPRTRG